MRSNAASRPRKADASEALNSLAHKYDSPARKFGD